VVLVSGVPESKVPYVPVYGNIEKALNKIVTASTPDRFTQDFLATKLDMKGGSPKPVIPFLKRIGFLATDGMPTERYKRFRNSSQRGAAAAEALKTGFSALYDLNEYVHDASDADLKGVIVQATGLEESARSVARIMGSFKALRAFADFDAAPEELDEDGGDGGGVGDGGGGSGLADGLKLSYAITLQLPATSDIAVFNAIFKSLREHLLSD